MPILKHCLACNKEYKVPKYREESAKYCSRECQNHGQYQAFTKVCGTCNKEFTVSNSRQNKVFCSLLCRTHTKVDLVERRKKAKRAAIISRGTFTGATLRKFVFDSKQKECEICGYDEYDFCLDVHHIDENPRNNVLENLAVLCCMCHKKLHKGVIEYAIEKR